MCSVACVTKPNEKWRRKSSPFLLPEHCCSTSMYLLLHTETPFIAAPFTAAPLASNLKLHLAHSSATGRRSWLMCYSPTGAAFSASLAVLAVTAKRLKRALHVRYSNHKLRCQEGPAPGGGKPCHRTPQQPSKGPQAYLNPTPSSSHPSPPRTHPCQPGPDSIP